MMFFRSTKCFTNWTCRYWAITQGSYKAEVKFVILKKSVSVVIDFIGKHVKYYDPGDGTVECTLIVNREAMRRWAIQMAGTVKVVSPPELMEEIRETIRKMAAEYQV